MESVNLKDIQDKLLEIAVYFDEFCQEHQIDYFLMGGTALGAIRHQGFIPWDDDYDVFMTYKNYEKLLNSMDDLDVENYYFQRENTKEWPLMFSKLRRNKTTYIETDTMYNNMHQGFYIDIMCLNNMSNCFFLRLIQFMSAKIIVAATLKRRGYVTNNILKKTFMIFSNIFLRKWVFKILLKIVRGKNNKDTKYVGHLFGRAKYKNSIYKSDLFNESKRVRFQNEFFPVMKNVDFYLKKRFGDTYLEIPSHKTREQFPSHIFYANPNVDYKSIDLEKIKERVKKSNEKI